MTTKHVPKVFGQTARYGGKCLHCGKWITAQTHKQWHRLTKGPCPHCGRPGS